MKNATQTPTLDRPATYQIKVPGQLNAHWLERNGSVTIAVDSQSDGRAVTTLTGSVDQAALHGLLRRLYAVGLPIISVLCIECT